MEDEKSDQQQLAEWAASCAERVLGIFAADKPDDVRPRKAVEAARRWAAGEIPVSASRGASSAAHRAARETEDPAAKAAARAAGHAAATAHMAGHAAHAASYARSAVVQGANGGDAAGDAELEWQKEQLPGHLWEEAFPAAEIPQAPG
ncbi:MAG TPA: hypothetical protein VHJ78_07845 [Actinomycetota bacterium]|nr:hypothetical protein [Actinomycetota bacterium]